MSLLPLATLLEQMARLNAIYPRPRWAPHEPAAFAMTFHEVLGHLTVVQLTTAVTDYLRSPARYYPRPGELLEFVKRIDVAAVGGLEGQYWAWERNGWSGPCPVCGSTVERTGRAFVLHDPQRHREAGIGYVGRDPAEHARALRPTGATRPSADATR